MTRRLQIALAMATGFAPAGAWAQTHVVKKPETVVRAVAVYEWTGPEAKPTGSRLVPVSIFIDAQLQDAGVYLARPVPFSLDVGTVFEMQKAGRHEGTLDIAFQRHLEAGGATPFDNGWLAYGILKPVAPPGTEVATKQKGPLPQIVASGGKPQFAKKPDAADTSTPAASTDPNRPTMTRRPDSGDASSGTTASSDSNKPVLQKRSDTTTPTTDDSTASDDPHRPTLTRRPDSSTPDDTSTPPTPSSGRTSSTTSPDATDDAERPTLKRRTPEETQAKKPKRQGDVASVQSVGSLNDDPDRPSLHRGTAAPLDIPPLEGLPPDMKQMVAVSDAKDRPEHDFARPWENDQERTDILTRMQELARARLATYDVPAPVAAAATPAPTPKAAPGTRPRKPVATPPHPPAPAELADESLHSYTLSYGGAATFVYTATSPGIKGATRYVTVIAQREPLGEVKQALVSVTDTNHLDRTPWMRLVDVVDAESSNRASMLFEMRGQHSRQFALYRVIGARSDQVFETGTTQ